MTTENSVESKSFNYFWDNIFVPTFNIMIKETELHPKDAPALSCRKEYYKTYIELREKYKDEYHVKGKDGKLSIFKIAAIICNLFIEKKAFSFETDKRTIENSNKFTKDCFIDSYLINYKFAFYCGFGILYIAALSKYATNKDIIKKLTEKKNLFLLRNKNSKKDGYEDYIIKNLALNDLKKIPFDTTYLSIIYRLYNAYSFVRLGINDFED